MENQANEEKEVLAEGFDGGEMEAGRRVDEASVDSLEEAVEGRGAGSGGVRGALYGIYGSKKAKELEDSLSVVDEPNVYSEALITRLNKRVEKLYAKRPILVSNSGVLFENCTEKVSHLIAQVDTVKEHIMGLFTVGKTNMDTHRLFLEIEAKVGAKLERGTLLEDDWELKIESEVKRIDLFQKNKAIDYYILDRDTKKEIERNQSKSAADFTQKMVNKSAQMVMKREQEQRVLEEMRQNSVFQMMEVDRQKKHEQMNKNRSKAIGFLEALKVKKAERAQTLIDCRKREKEVLSSIPLYVKNQLNLDSEQLLGGGTLSKGNLEKTRKRQFLIRDNNRPLGFLKLDRLTTKDNIRKNKSSSILGAPETQGQQREQEKKLSSID
jgi:hypothetical protein